MPVPDFPLFAGLTYDGKRFTDNFHPFIDKYGITDMYSAGFYPYPSAEEKWAYWAKHVLMNRYEIAENGLHKKLYELFKDKNYFVLTTNVDGLFEKAGFDTNRIFATQGDYKYFQCKKPVTINFTITSLRFGQWSPIRKTAKFLVLLFPNVLYAVVKWK